MMGTAFPYKPFSFRIVLRATGMWIALRGLFAWGAAGAGGSVGLSWRAAFVLVFLAGSLTYLDARRRHEPLFLANCGVPSWSVVVLCTGPAFVLEILFHLGLAAWMLF